MNYKANITLTKAKKKKEKITLENQRHPCNTSENDLRVVTYRINEGKEEILRTHS